MTFSVAARGLLAGWFCSLLPMVSPSTAAEPSAESAHELVRQALRAELVGDNQLRRQRLEGAAALDPEYGPAQWQLGKVRLPGKATWQSAREMTAIPKEIPFWAKYRTMRDACLRLPEVIWSTDEAPLSRTFRVRFELGTRPRSGEIRVGAFRSVSVSINGHEVRLENGDGGTGLSGIQKHLRSGENTLAVLVENGVGAAGVAVWLGCTFPDDRVHAVATDPTWEVRTGSFDGWFRPFATDNGWSAAVAAGENVEAWDNIRRPIHSPQVDAALARWCWKKSLEPQSRFHWARVLEANPLDQEAIRALDLKRDDGLLWTRDEMAERRESARLAKLARTVWDERLSILQELAAGGDSSKIGRYLAESESDLSPAAAAVLASAASESADLGFVSAILDLLSRTEEPAATEGLVHVTIQAGAEPVRELALERLQSHAGERAAPFLLPLLQLPLRIQTRQAEQNSDKLTLMANQIQFVDRRADHDVVHLDERSVLLKPFMGHSYRVWRQKIDANRDGIVDRSDLNLMKSWIVPTINSDLKASAESLVRESMQSQLLAARTFADQENLRREIQNQRVFATLRATTGLSVNQRVSAWWQWWIDCNSLAMSPVRGVKLTRRTAYGIQRYEYRTAGWCCFVAGTPIWTRQGLVPVEQIHAGDEVLSQDPDTGELAYKIVTFTTIRPPSPVLTLTAGGDSVTTTLGHRFWRTGAGWIMAKQVSPGIPLHQMDGSYPLDLVAPAGDAPAYNLVVDDFHTYFVGEAGWLVHDNRLPAPGNVLLPGLLAEPGEVVESVPGCGLHKALIKAAEAQVAN